VVPKVSVYFIIISVRKLLDTLSYTILTMQHADMLRNFSQPAYIIKDGSSLVTNGIMITFQSNGWTIIYIT